MTSKEIEGYELAKGAARFVGRVLIITSLVLTLLVVLRGAFRWGMDDSDAGPWLRSGLIVHTDAKTGVQYLSDGHGGLVWREAN